jgi:hypothetical protein
MLSLRKLQVIVLLSGSIWDGQAYAGTPLSAEHFRELHAMVKPHPKEAPWHEIQWTADLWQARTRAAAENKPLFVWSAAAEPAGCT